MRIVPEKLLKALILLWNKAFLLCRYLSSLLGHIKLSPSPILIKKTDYKGDNMSSKSEFLGTENVHKLILKFGSFSVITMLATGAVSMIGTLIVSKGIDIHAVGAMGVLFPLITVYFGFSQLVAIGSASYISRMLGKDQQTEVKASIFVAYALTLILSILLIGITWLFMDQILTFLGADGEYEQTSRTYLSIFIYSIPFTAMTLLSSAIFRAYGKLNLSMLVILIESGLIIGLDALLIFVFSAGIIGVAVSNSIAGVIASIVGIILLIKINGGKQNLKAAFKWDLGILKNISNIGISALGRSLATAIFAFILNKAVAQLGGDEALTALGTVNRIIVFLLFAIMGINQAVQPILSYNYTAQKSDRVKQSLKYALIYATLIGLVGTFLGLFIPDDVVAIFTSNADILDDATLIFKMQLVLYLTVGIQTLSATYFQAIGNAWKSFFLSVFKPLLILIPLIYFLPYILENSILILWWIFPIADIFATIVCLLLLRRGIKN